jgi:hypothetical protein
MKANELRIGNKIIFSEDGTIFTVGSIEEKGFMVQNEEETAWIESEEFEPIPLTEEWLLKFGFAWKNFAFRDGKFTVRFQKEFYVYLSVEGIRPITIKLDYVHQLQNLYFTLTGEELTYGGIK